MALHLGTTVSFEVKLDGDWVTLEGTLIGFRTNGFEPQMVVARNKNSGLTTYVPVDNIVSHELPEAYEAFNKFNAGDLDKVSTCY